VIRDEQGQAGGLEGIAFGLLIFVLGTLLIANAWAVVDTKLAVTAAAREAARAFVESDDAPAADSNALRAANDTLAGHGRSPDRGGTDVKVDGSFVRCQRITAVVGYSVPLVSIPLIGRYGSGIRVVAHHSELVDPYRSGPPVSGPGCV
jgi:hypothetical protein